MANTLGISYHVLLDPNMELMKELNLNSFPSMAIVNSKGKVVWFHEGFNEGDQEEIRNELNRQLSLTHP
jgi:protein-disulfide isomerase-like protein with CxxC motif